MSVYTGKSSQTTSVYQKREMKINGSDLIKMGVEPGPKLGDILDRLYEQVLDDPSLNEAQKLKELANKIITSLI